MIATRLGLAIAAAIAVLLAVVLALDLGRAPPRPVDRAIAPGFDAAVVEGLRWERGGEVVELRRIGGRWQLRSPVVADSDPAAIEAVLATLRAARWQRRAAATAAGATTATLTIHAAAGSTVIGFGGELAGAEQAWLVVGDHALLVDRWIARALAPRAVELIARRPFADVAEASTVRVVDGAGEVVVAGTPRRLERPIALVLAPSVGHALEASLAGLELVSLAPATAAPATGLQIAADTVTATLGGACPDGGIRLDAPTGRGCVTAAAAAAVAQAIAGLRAEPIAVAEPRPAPLDPSSITLADGGVLDLARLPAIDGGAADPSRVAELVATLHAPAERRVDDATASRVVGRLTVRDRAGATITLELLAPDRVRRAGEPVALRLTKEAWALLARPGTALRELTLWTEEPIAIATIAIDGARFERGAVVGEWVLGGTPVGASRAGQLDALAIQLARPAVVAGEAPAFERAHRIGVEVAAPGGATVTRELGLGRPTRDGCPAQVEARRVWLARGLCEAIAALAERGSRP